jgi:hypothetical protein
VKRVVLAMAILLLGSALIGVETRNRFSLLAGAEDGVQGLGAVWTLDLQHQESLGVYSAQAGYSMHAYALNTWEAKRSLQMDAETYRWWLSLQNPQSELRIGLQQINFGVAQVLRPLKWFDTLQAQDPYQLSRGVDALLFRHYWLNNANLWLWGLPGSGDLKGIEFLPGKEDSAEYGGRIQYPLAIGEGAISAHYRKLEVGEEYRVGFDLRYDGTIGAWLETAGSHFSKSGIFLPAYTASATLGLDYVWAYGNGLALTLENMINVSAEASLGTAKRQNLSTAALFSYPLGLLDSVSLLAYADWDGGDWALNAAWRRMYDYISLDLNLGSSSLKDFQAQAMISVNL